MANARAEPPLSGARRKGELSAAGIDRGWPHQVALPADQVTGAKFDIVHGFCKGLSLCERGHCVRRDNVGYVVFCFADPAHAELFRARFNGERFDPKDRGRGSNDQEGDIAKRPRRVATRRR
jgi:hypothetical protein